MLSTMKATNRGAQLLLLWTYLIFTSGAFSLDALSSRLDSITVILFQDGPNATYR